MKLNIHIDGGSRGNPGPAAAAVVAHDAQTGAAVHEAAYFLGKMTNNAAEYHGLIKALELAARLGADAVHIKSDSQLMVEQINGRYKVKSADLRPLFEEARRRLEKIGHWSMEHVYREKNVRADELANRALDAGRDVEVKLGGRDAKTGAAVSEDPPERWWTAQLATPPGSGCPVKMATGRVFSFGPDTPAGFCVYAAQAVLAEGPLKGQPSRPVRCAKCHAAIRIKLIE